MTDALSALQAAAIKRVDSQLSALKGNVITMLSARIKASPGQSFDTIMISPLLRDELNKAVDTTHARISKDLKASYLAAGKLAARELKSEHGISAPANIDTDYLNKLMADVDSYMEQAPDDITSELRKAYQAVPIDHNATDPNSKLTQDRTAAVRAALDAELKRLAVRVRASNAVSVTRAYNDTKQAGYENYDAANPDTEVHKVWKVNSANPCPACAGLDGKSLGLAEDFDPAATTDPKYSLPGTHYGLPNPPRHPHCSCTIDIDIRPKS